MQPTYRGDGTPERTGSLFYATNCPARDRGIRFQKYSFQSKMALVGSTRAFNSSQKGPGHCKGYQYSSCMVVELDLSPDCEAALMAAAKNTGRTVDETVHLAVQAFIEQQDTEQWRAEANRNMVIHAETLRRLGG